MKLPLLYALCVAALVGPTSHILAQGLAQDAAATAPIITISCYRGPWDDVIWDRPNPEFTQSLVGVGYTYPEAYAIGERVCRDPATVNHPDGMVVVMNQILVQSPPGRR